jgi:hypothetical protein
MPDVACVILGGLRGVPAWRQGLRDQCAPSARGRDTGCPGTPIMRALGSLDRRTQSSPGTGNLRMVRLALSQELGVLAQPQLVHAERGPLGVQQQPGSRHQDAVGR